MKRTLFYVLAMAWLTISCNKSDSIENNSIDTKQNEASASYLTFSDANDFFAEIDKVSQMDDFTYSNWKNENHLSKTLFDRFLEVENRISAYEDGIQRKSNLSIDSNYFFFANDGERLFSRNGVILDKLLNENGVVKVGNYMIRYQNGKVYYVGNADNKSENLLNQPNLSENSLLALIEENNGKTVNRATMHTISPVWGQNTTYNYILKSQRFEYSKRKHFVDLKEQYILVPYSGTPDYPYLTGWNISYRLYFEFGQHKKILFTWNKYASSTRCSVITASPLTGRGTGSLPYMPGTWLYNSYSNPTFTSLTGSFTTSATDHPIYNIYGVNSNHQKRDLTFLYSVTDAKLHAKLSADDIPEHDFYFDPAVD